METDISVQVHRLSGDQDYNYRLYINDDLITERTWIWRDCHVFVEENFKVDIDPNNLVNIRLDPILSSPMPDICHDPTTFMLRVLKINGYLRPDFGDESLPLSFAI